VALDPEVALKDAAAALEQYGSVDLALLPSAAIKSLVLSSERLLNRAQAMATRTVAAFDATGTWLDDGARNAASWLAWKALLHPDEAKAQVRCGRALRSMPLVEAAFLAGDLTARHVQLLVRAWKTNGDAFAEGGEELLLDIAGTMDAKRFARAVKYWRHVNDPDRAESDAADRHERREAHCSSTFEDMVELRATFDPVGGAIYAEELRRLEQEMFEHDWAEARAAFGDKATASHLLRTPAQRRADAMVEMARRSAAMAPASKQARPLITVHVDHETLLGRICELADGTVLAPGELLPLLHEADFERVVFGPGSRVLDVGVRQRLFTGATRRAVHVRDRSCGHPSCDEPAERCDVHHLVDYDDGGLTVQENGKAWCPFHHRRHHQRQRGVADDDGDDHND
jgi:hypothetical protein